MQTIENSVTETYEFPELRLPNMSRSGGLVKVTTIGDRVSVRLSQLLGGTFGTQWVHSDEEMALDDFNKFIKPTLLERGTLVS
jgi:hypothetical protein